MNISRFRYNNIANVNSKTNIITQLRMENIVVMIVLTVGRESVSFSLIKYELCCYAKALVT